MSKRTPKVLTPEQMEEIRTKDFFDMILPGTVKFLSDHYIVGDSYRCVWVIREYPPSTEEQVKIRNRVLNFHIGAQVIPMRAALVVYYKI